MISKKGIVKQINETNPKANVSLEYLEKVLKDIMYGEVKPDGTKTKGIFKELPEGFNLDEQIQDGYMYQTSGDIVLMTGAGGIRDIIRAQREAGIPDFIIAQSIYVTDYYNQSTQAYWIGDVKWTPIEK